MNAGTAADVGSGAGFPLLPLALATPRCRWTAVESIAKKARFIQETAQALGLTNTKVLAERAEDVGRGEFRESFDLVTARAVGSVAALCEVCVPLLRLGGVLLLYKTEGAVEETEGLKSVIELLGARADASYRYRLPGDEQDRVILRIQKVGVTPQKYPRAAGVPFKKPLAGR